MTATDRTSGPSSSLARTAWLAARAAAVLTLAALVLIFGTAGVLVSRGSALDLHGAGAIVLHVGFGLLTVALAVAAWGRVGSWVAAGASAVVFALSFYQAWLGSQGDIPLHVPGAFVMTAAGVGLAAYTVRRPATAPR
ncbi:hypothetical protein GCM10009737_24490 [Nocardioides lentus]|uniref:Integral membrane protein n=1 Tax=Nocardioides lentus TaxID=338077 RepID=A0ABN2PHL1_9ACTN